jgi:hypothetical protein
MEPGERVSTFIVSTTPDEKYRYDLVGGCGVEAIDPVDFTRILLDHIAERRELGYKVRIEQGVKEGFSPLPEYLFPTEYL